MNILTANWPTTSVAHGLAMWTTRHNRSSLGNVFSLGGSISYRGQNPEARLDKPEVSR